MGRLEPGGPEEAVLFFGQAVARFKPTRGCRGERNCGLDMGDMEEGQIHTVTGPLTVMSSDLEDVSLWCLWGHQVVSSGDMDSLISVQLSLPGGFGSLG